MTIKCKKGYNRCASTKKCYRKHNEVLKKRCKNGTRKCANKYCYKKNASLLASSRKSRMSV